jgi:hypothetical protein
MADRDEVLKDAIEKGVGFSLDGKHVPHEDVYLTVDEHIKMLKAELTAARAEAERYRLALEMVNDHWAAGNFSRDVEIWQRIKEALSSPKADEADDLQGTTTDHLMFGDPKYGPEKGERP